MCPPPSPPGSLTVVPHTLAYLLLCKIAEAFAHLYLLHNNYVVLLITDGVLFNSTGPMKQLVLRNKMWNVGCTFREAGSISLTADGLMILSISCTLIYVHLLTDHTRPFGLVDRLEQGDDQVKAFSTY